MTAVLGNSMLLSSILQNPLAISSCQLWLDADDFATITQSGGNVSQWNDKSGNNRNAIQGTGANQPTYALNSQGGKPTLFFDGVNDFMSVLHNTALNPGTGGLSIFVANKTFTTANAFYISKGSANATTLGYAIVQSVQGMRARDASGNNVSLPTFVTPTPFQILTYTFSGSSAVGYLNNVIVGSPGSYTATINSTSNFVISASPTSTVFGSQNIGEILVYNRLLSLTEITQLNGYLRNKWGT